ESTTLREVGSSNDAPPEALRERAEDGAGVDRQVARSRDDNRERGRRREQGDRGAGALSDLGCDRLQAAGVPAVESLQNNPTRSICHSRRQQPRGLVRRERFLELLRV